jgi:hypothetical protein
LENDEPKTNEPKTKNKEKKKCWQRRPITPPPIFSSLRNKLKSKKTK